MKMAGAHTIAQDEKSSVVFGMPEQAIRQGGVCEIVSLDRIAERMIAWANSEDKPDSERRCDLLPLP